MVPTWDTGAQPQRVLPPLHTDGKSANISLTYEDQDTCDRHQLTEPEDYDDQFDVTVVSQGEV